MTPIDWVNIALTVGGFLMAAWLKHRQPPTLPPAVPPPVIPQPAPPSSGNPLIDQFMKWLAEQKPNEPPTTTTTTTTTTPEPPPEQPDNVVEELIGKLLDVLRRKAGRMP